MGIPWMALAAAPAALEGRISPVFPQPGDELAGDVTETSLRTVVQAPGVARVIKGIARGQDLTGD